MATSLSQAALSYKVNQTIGDIENAVSEPFLDENTDGRTSDDPPKPTGLKAMKHSFVFGCAIGTVIINILIMIGASTATVIAGIVALIVSLTVAGSEMKLENLDTLRSVHNALRADVNIFSVENKKLGTNIDELQQQNFFLKETEQRLKDTVGDQEVNVKSLVNIIDENEAILFQKRKIILQDIVSDLMDTVMKGDRSDDNELSKSEMNRMIHYMRGLPAVQINEELLQAKLKKDNSVLAIMELIQDIGEPGEQEGDAIFIIDTEDDELRDRVMNKSSSH